MKISACLIVKDDSELEKLKKAVASIISYVDGVYITATGEDIDGIEAFCKEPYLISTQGLSPKIHYSYFKWCDDFSAARNFNFSQAPQDSDYIFWMDADDILVGGEQFRKLAEMSIKYGKDVVFLPYWYGCSFKGEPSFENMVDIEITQYRERLLRPGVITWKGRLHETPVPVEGAKNVYTTVKYTDNPQREGEFSIALLHTALEKDLPPKMERNKRILELQLEEERQRPEGADPRTIIYLIKIYAEGGNEEEWKKVIEMGEEYLSKSGWNEERGTAWENMGIAYGRLNEQRKAVDCFINAIKEWPHSILYYIRLARALYNIKDYEAVKHWLNVASQMDMDKKLTSGTTNFKGIKVLFAELLLGMNYYVEKDTKKALEAATLLYQEDPTPESKDMKLFLQDLNDLNDACAHVDRLTEYLDSIGREDDVIKILDILPQEITSNPFAHRIRQKVSKPRVWKDNEICYFANFGGKFFEPWSAGSLETGIGGSETAVIELSKEWSKRGYKVTVYGDPGANRGDHEGVTYLPWYEFNPRDFFNIFIQWRGWQLANQVKARKFLVDLHDIYSVVDLKAEQLRSIDKIMVKSNYHRKLAPTIPDEKFEVISNGIRI